MAGRPTRLALLAAAAILAGAGAAPAGAEALDARDRLIVPGERIGAVARGATLDDLKRVYGADIAIGRFRTGGGTLEGAILFARTGPRLEIEADLATGRVRRVAAGSAGPTGPDPWRTTEGIRVGTTLAELEAINGRALTIRRNRGAGGGFVVSDPQGGRFPPALEHVLGPTDEIDQRDLRRLEAPEGIASDDPLARKAAFVVRALFVTFER